MSRPVSGSRTSPTAFTAMSAPRCTPSRSRTAQPSPPFVARAMPWSLPTLAPVPAPTLPSATGPGRAPAAARMAHRAIGPRAVGSPSAEVVEDGAGHVGHHGLARGEADAALLEVAHHAPDRLEAEGAAAGQDDAVERGHEVTRVEELEAVHAGRPAADLDAAHRGRVAAGSRCSR